MGNFKLRVSLESNLVPRTYVQHSIAHLDGVG